MDLVVLLCLVMAAVSFLAGAFFYVSNGKAANILPCYNMKSDEEKKKIDEKNLCKEFGKSVMFWSIPYLCGAAVYADYDGKGFEFACIFFVVMFLFILRKRNNIEE